MNDLIKETKGQPINRQRDIVVSRITEALFSQHERHYRAWTTHIASLLNNPLANIETSSLQRWEHQLEEYGFRRVDGKVQIPNLLDADLARIAETRRQRALRILRDEISKLVSDEYPRLTSLSLYTELLSDKSLLNNVLRLPKEDDIQRLIRRNDEESQQIRERLEIRDLLFQEENEAELLRVEDAAPLTYLHLLLNRRTQQSNNYDHIVVDEAQDVAPLEMWLLRQFVASDSMTLLGDLAQSIHSYRGIDRWEDFDEVFDQDRVQYEEIERTYRFTHEIMTFANRVLETKILGRLMESAKGSHMN